MKLRWHIFSLLLILVLSGLSIHDLTPPRALPATAPAATFSAERAMQHLRVIAQNPRPTGSAANVRARAYLIEQLKALGLAPVTQSADPVAVVNGLAAAGPVTNVLVRLPGSDSTGAIVLLAHFDSVAMGPGAGDDGCSAAALLETIRALKAGSPLRNDVIFLFADGEERYMLGSAAFVAEHPWAHDVRLAFNFDNRGMSGSDWMFETGPGNRWLIRHFGQAVPHPVTSSLLNAAYKLVPNITDFQPFKESGINGLNFAIIGSSYSYHSAVDNVNRISAASVQHQGDTVLGLAEHFGNLDLRQQPTADDDAVFFPVPGLRMVAYSERYVLPIQGALILLVVTAVVLGLRRKALTAGALLKGTLAVFASGAAAGAAVWAACQLAAATARGPLATLTGGTYHQPLYDLGFALLAGTMALLLHRWYRRHLSVGALLAGAALTALLLGSVVAYFVPGLSYLFQWPLLATGIALLCAYLAPDPDATWVKLLQLLPTAVLVLLYTLAADALLLALPVAMHFLLFGLLVLSLGATAPLLDTATVLGRWLLPAAGALGAAGLLTAAVLMSAPSATQPAEDTVWYTLDAGTGQAVWASLEAAPDDYTRQFVGGTTRRMPITDIMPIGVPMPVTVADAPAAPLSAPSITLIEAKAEGASRTLHLRASFAPHASEVYLRVSGGELLAATLNGKAIAVPGALAQVGLVYATPPDGFDLQLTEAGAPPLTVQIAAEYDGLPELLPQPASPRPPYLMPAHGLDGKSFVSRTFTFDPARK